MAPRISDQLRARIINWHDSLNLSPQAISRLAGCSIRSVYYILSFHRDFESIRKPGFHYRCGRRRTLDTGDINYMLSYVRAHPKVYLDEIQDALSMYRSVNVSLATISRALRRMAFTNKAVSKAALERNEMLRGIWQVEYGHHPADYYVWLDESSVDDFTNARRSGWAEAGRACVSRDTFIRGKRFSILPALTWEGMITLDIFEGSVNKERFINYIRKDVAPLLNPFPGPRSVVVLDNCAIHHDEEVRRIIEEDCGAKLIYLPPYSPDFNPIEQGFHNIKSWLRRHEAMAINPAVRPWLIHQARDAVTSEMACGWIQNCGYSFHE